MNVDWLHLYLGDTNGDLLWWQMALRAAVIFLLGIAFVRFASSRAFGKWSALDIILAVVVGSNLSRAMTGNAPFVPTILATGLLVLLHGLLARASARWSWLSTLTKGSSVRLVRDGRIDQGAMRSCGIGEGDLRMALRAQGHSKLDAVKSAWLERNGDITVVTYDEA